MTEREQENIIREFYSFIGDKAFPCVAARGALSRNHLPCLVLEHFECPEYDPRMLLFLYDFILHFRQAVEPLHSAVIIFKAPEIASEEVFDNLLWRRLQSLSLLDARNFSYDKRVSPDPSDPDFSFSVGEEAFFVIGLHPASSRPSRKFKYPAIVFNPHAQFEALRHANRYEKMKNIVRQRDMIYSGSINPMLSDFGQRSEAHQYSGRQYDAGWECPLKVTHGETKHYSSAQQRVLHNEKRPAPENN